MIVRLYLMLNLKGFTHKQSSAQQVGPADSVLLRCATQNRTADLFVMRLMIDITNINMIKNILFSLLIFQFANLAYAHDEQKELVQILKSKGITYLNTDKVIIYGSQADYGSNTKVLGEWSWLIQKIWDKIYQSRSFDEWAMSGYRTIEFYKKESKLKVTLLVNETDVCFIENENREKGKKGFRCPGLNEFLMNLLKYEYEKNQKSIKLPR